MKSFFATLLLLTSIASFANDSAIEICVSETLWEVAMTATKSIAKNRGVPAGVLAVDSRALDRSLTLEPAIRNLCITIDQSVKRE